MSLEIGEIMKESVPLLSNRSYYIFIFFIIIMMFVGLLVENPLFQKGDIRYFVHFLLVSIVSISLLIYPLFYTRFLRFIIVLVSTTYLYTLFFLYPDTGSTIILLCFIPAISIMFFDAKLFYFSLILNIVLMLCTLSYIKVNDLQGQYLNITNDFVGTFINFIGSQTILFFIFYLTFDRLKRTQSYYEHIKHAERLKTVGELAAAVAHEIRNPLTVVKGYLQLYEKDEMFDQSKQKSLALLIEELDSAEQVLYEFLSLSKPTKDKAPERININNVLYNVTDLLQSYGLLNQNKIEVAMEEELFIAINKMELNQLLVNIIKNAIEASIIGEPIKVMANIIENTVEIKVIDYGLGMTKQELELLGTPFYSLKSKGTGLGIMICHNIAAKYGGTIHYDSIKGKGTTVTISFPLVIQ